MSNEAKWVRITEAGNIPLREGRLAVVDGRQIAIFNLGDRFLAIENRCPHRGGPLVEGIVSGTTVVCPLHAWKIDLETGRVANPASPVDCLPTYPTRVVNGSVELGISPVSEPDAPSVPDCVHRDRPLRWVQRKPLSPVAESRAST